MHTPEKLPASKGGPAGGAVKSPQPSPMSAMYPVSPAAAARGPMTPDAVLTLQRAVGRQAVARALGREEHVHGADCGHGAVQRRAVVETAQAPAELLDDAMASTSRPIEGGTLKKAQSFYQNDHLSRGRVHTGPLAQRAVAAFGATAMTVGEHIFFGAGVERDTATAFHEYGHLDKNTRGIAETGTDNGTGAPVTNPNQGSEREAATDGAAAAKGAEVAPSVAQRAVRQAGAPFAGSGAPVQRATVQRASYDDVDMEDYDDRPYIVDASPRRDRSRSRNPFAPSGSSRHRSSSAGSRRGSFSSMPTGPSREEPRFGPGSRPPVAGGRFSRFFSRRPERSDRDEESRGRSLRRADSAAMDMDMDMDMDTGYGTSSRAPSRAPSSRATSRSRTRSESRSGSSRYPGEEMDYEGSGPYGPAPSRSQQLFDRLAREARDIDRSAPRRDVGFRYAPQPADRSLSRRARSRRRSESVRLPSATTRLMTIGDKVLRDVKKKMKYGAANQAAALNAHGGATTARLIGGRSVRRRPVGTLQERLGQNAAAAEASGTGNCGEHAAMSFCLLNRQRLPAGVMIWHVTLSLDHAFIAVGYPGDPRNIVVIDPWQNNAGARRADQFNFPFLVADSTGNVGVTHEATQIMPDGEDYLRRGRGTIDFEHLEAQRDLPDDAFMNIDGLASEGGGLEPLHTWNHPMPPRQVDDRTIRSRMEEERHRNLRRQRARSTLRSSSRASSRSRWW